MIDGFFFLVKSSTRKTDNISKEVKIAREANKPIIRLKFNKVFFINGSPH